MKRNIFSAAWLIPILIIGLCFVTNVSAKEKISNLDIIIASTFKSLAKVFVATVDIERIKTININKLRKMKEEKYQKRFAEVYDTLKKLPPRFRAKYGINENMAKEDVINSIKAMDKNKMYKAIEDIPNSFIADEFKQYFTKKRRIIRENKVEEQIMPFWKKITRRAETIKK